MLFPLCCRKSYFLSAHCHSPYVFLLHSRIVCGLPTTEVIVSIKSLIFPSVLPCTFVLIFLGMLLYVLLIFHFLHNFGQHYRPVCLVFLYMRYIVYTEILMPIRSFLVLGVGRLLLHTGLLLVRFWKHLFIFLFLFCVCCLVFFNSCLAKLCYIVGRHRPSLSYILQCIVF